MTICCKPYRAQAIRNLKLTPEEAGYFVFTGENTNTTYNPEDEKINILFKDGQCPGHLPGRQCPDQPEPVFRSEKILYLLSCVRNPVNDCFHSKQINICNFLQRRSRD